MEAWQEGLDYERVASPPGSWRLYDPAHPEPGYGQFDTLSSSHPDLYDAFALTSDSLMQELQRLITLAGKVVLDVGAGTGRSTLAAARTARWVVSVDAYAAVVAFGSQRVRDVGLRNVTYARGLAEALPIADSSVDVVISVWAEAVSHREAFRVLKPEGYLIVMGDSPGSVCGELTPIVQGQDFGPSQDLFDSGAPTTETVLSTAMWDGIPLIDGVHVHDFTCRTNWKSIEEAAAILGRL